MAADAQIRLTVNLQNNHLCRGMEVADGCVVFTDLGYTFANNESAGRQGIFPDRGADNTSVTVN